jgi:hypothetical protein
MRIGLVGMTLSDQPILPPLVLTARQLAKLYGVDQPPPAWAPVPNADAEALALQARIVGEGPRRRRRQELQAAAGVAATLLLVEVGAHVIGYAFAAEPLAWAIAGAVGWALRTILVAAP